MKERYLYWRGRNGTVDRDNSAPIELLNRLGASATLDSNGIIHFSMDMLYNKLELSIQSLAVIMDSNKIELNRHDTHIITMKSLVSAIKKCDGQLGKLNKYFSENVNAMAKDFFRLQSIKYTMVSTLSTQSLFSEDLHFDLFCIKPIHIEEYFQIPSVVNRHPDFLNYFPKTRYSRIQVSTAGRSVSEAFELATGALDAIRGLWTLIETYGTWRIKEGLQKISPIGVIHKGPIHLLYNTDKTLVDDICWYDMTNLDDHKLYQPKNGWDHLESRRATLSDIILSSQLKTDILQILARYANALDKTDIDTSFMHLWGILEKITNSVARFDDTIKRASMLYVPEDRTIVKKILESMRARRNLYVHSFESTEKPDQSSLLVKSIVDEHIYALIRNAFSVNCLADHGKALESSPPS